MNYKRSFVDAAYDIILKNEAELAFAKIWEAVCNELELTEEDKVNRVAYFYTQLTLDGRFVTLGENVWDLRIRHTFDKVHIDMNEVYTEEDEEELEFVPEEDEIKDDVDRLTSADDDEDYDEEEEDEE